MNKHSAARSPSRRPRAFASVSLLIAVAAAALAPAARDLALRELDNRVRAELSRSAGYAVTFDALRLTAVGASITNLRARARDGASQAPLTVRRIDLAVDWWALLASRSLHVPSVVVDGAELSIDASTAAAGAPTTVTYASVLRDITRSGLRSVEVRNSVLHVAGTSPGAPEITASPISATLRIDPRGSLSYDIAAASVRAAPEHISAISRLELHGHADTYEVVLARGLCDWLGGAWRGHGAWNPVDLTSRASIEVQGLPLTTARSVFGITEPVIEGSPIDAVGTLELAGARVQRAHGSVHALAGRLRLPTGPMGWRSLMSSFEWNDREAKLRLTGLRLVGDGLALTGDLAIATAQRADSRAGAFEARGRLTGDRRGIADAARRLRLPNRINEAPWRIGNARIDFRVHGDAARLAAASASGHAHIDNLVVAPLAGADSSTIASIDADFVRSAHRVELRRVHLGVAGVELAGDVTLTSGRDKTFDRVSVNGSATLQDVRRLAAMFPQLQIGRVVVPLAGAEARATFHVAASLIDREDLQATGTLEGSKIRIEIPSPHGSPVPASGLPIAVSNVAADFRYDARGLAQGRDTLAISNLRGQGASGSFRGNADLGGGRRFGLHLVADDVDIDLVRWVVPGQIRGGRLNGTLNIAGDDGVGVRSLEGRFTLANAQYVIPRELEWTAEPFTVSTFSGDYRWNNGDIALRNVSLRSDRVFARGEIVHVGSETNVRASIETPDMGRAVTTWPMFAGLIHGGSATAQLTVRIDPSGARGRVLLNGVGGTLVVPEVDPAIARQPITSSSVTLDFSPERIAFTNAALRGPKLNVVTAGQWTHRDSALQASGRAWLTREYASELLRGYRWLTRLIGVHDLTTDVVVRGTKERMMVHASIAHSLLWKLAGSKIPSDIRAIARGDAPFRFGLGDTTARGPVDRRSGGLAQGPGS